MNINEVSNKLMFFCKLNDEEKTNTYNNIPLIKKMLMDKYVKGKEEYDFYLNIIPHFHPNIKSIAKNKVDIDSLSNKLLNKHINGINAKDLDYIWLFYFITNDSKYANKVKDISLNSNNNVTKMAAVWSYDDIINNKNI